MSENKHHECDCGCEHEHSHEHSHDENCDCGCDCGCEDEEVVMLQDADGNEVAFHYVYNMEHEGKEYVFLQAAEAGDNDDEIEIFEVHTVEEDGQYYDMLDPVEDDLYDVLYEKLLLVASEDECENDNCEDCEDQDCACRDCEEENCDDCDKPEPSCTKIDIE